MRAELHIVRRYLIGLRRRTHVATVTLISLVGLGLGVAYFGARYVLEELLNRSWS